MDDSRAQFLELIRAALWRKTANASMFVQEVKWSRIFRISQEQAAIGIAYSGMMTLPESMRPDKIVLLRWYGMVVKLEAIYQKHLTVLSQMNSFYAELGFHPVLLKGLGVAALYPDPDRRQCGDIDLYVPQAEAYPKMLEILKREGLYEGGEENFKHYHFSLDGVVVEIHRKMVCMLNPFYEKSLQRFIEEAMRHRRNAIVGGVEVSLLPVWFDPIFLIIHMSTHLAEDGLGIRQISDWALFLSAHAEEIEREKMIEQIRRLGLTNDWKLYEAFSVKYLGLDQNVAIMYDARFERKADRLADIVFAFGNFGKMTDVWDNRPHSYLARKIYALCVHVRYFVRSFRVVPMDALCNILFIYSRSAWDRLKKGE